MVVKSSLASMLAKCRCRPCRCFYCYGVLLASLVAFGIGVILALRGIDSFFEKFYFCINTTSQM